MQERIYFHSPFSEKNVGTPPHPFLLLSFILSEFFTCLKTPSDTWVFSSKALPVSFVLIPESSPFYKLQEHSSLLPFAFPHKTQETITFQNELFFLAHHLKQQNPDSHEEKLKHLFSLFIPFIEEGEKSETFLFFLLKHQKEIALLTTNSYLSDLFEKIQLKSFMDIENRLCDYFHKKGFTYLIEEVKNLFSQISEGSIL